MTRHEPHGISAEGLATARREDFTGYPADHDTEREVSIVGLPAAQLTNGRIRQGRVGFPAHAGMDRARGTWAPWALGLPCARGAASARRSLRDPQVSSRGRRLPPVRAALACPYQKSR